MPLSEEQATEVREIAEQEVRRFAGLLREEVGRTPMRADGAVNARDFYDIVDDAQKRYFAGEFPE